VWTVSVAHIEPWLDKRAIAARYACSERWIEYREREGMPSYLIAGRRKYRASECDAWLVEHGYIARA
jgi:hypothetical protein